MPKHDSNVWEEQRPLNTGTLFWAVILMLVGIPGAYAKVTIHDPGTFIVDRANIVEESIERQLEGWLRELEQKTDAQVKLLTVPSIEDEPVFDFAQRHAELWALGKKGKDNGALVVVALQEREFRIHPGYGLEPSLPDSWCGSLHRNVIVPEFRKGNYSAGAYQAMVAIANKVADNSNVKLTGIPDYRHAPSALQAPLGRGVRIVPFIVLFIILAFVLRRRRSYRRWGGGMGEAVFWGILSNLGRGGGGWGGGSRGGGFGGGGFGGSFGGGGRFGGGGGGGRW